MNNPQRHRFGRGVVGGAIATLAVVAVWIFLREVPALKARIAPLAALNSAMAGYFEKAMKHPDQKIDPKDTVAITAQIEKNVGQALRNAGYHEVSEADVTAAKLARKAAVVARDRGRDGVNAADLYEAAAVLFGQLTESDKDALVHQTEGSDSKSADALDAKVQPIMNLLRMARKADYADWGPVPISQADWVAQDDEISIIQKLAGFGIRMADAHFKSDPTGAIEDIAAVDTMGRSAVSDFLGLLVHMGVHMLAIRHLEQHVTMIPAASATDIASILNPAAAEQCFRRGMDGEAFTHQSHLDEYANPATRKGSYIQTTLDMAHSLIGPDPNQVLAQLAWLKQADEEIGMHLMDPEAEFQNWWAAKTAKAASMPLAAEGLDTAKRITTKARELAVASAMLDAALALEWHDQAHFKSIMDPSTGKPFTYTKTAEGFQLDSPMLDPLAQQANPHPASEVWHGKPLTRTYLAPAGF